MRAAVREHAAGLTDKHLRHQAQHNQPRCRNHRQDNGPKGGEKNVDNVLVPCPQRGRRNRDRLVKGGADLRDFQIRSGGRGRDEEEECATYQAYLMRSDYTAYFALSVAEATIWALLAMSSTSQTSVTFRCNVAL